MQRTKCYAVTMSRTETAKKLRKAYESHLIHHGFNEYRYMTVRIKQATKQGYALCEVGGGRF